MQAPRVILVEDDPHVRQGLEASLRSSGYDVTALPDGTRLHDVIAADPPDAIVVDVTLPVGPDGFELARQVRETGLTPLLFLTAADDLDARLRGFAVGADDYLVKPFSTREFLARLGAILRRASPPPGGPATVGDLVIDVEAGHARRGGCPLDLTPTEFALLAALAGGQGRSITKRDLLREVWGYDAYDVHLVEVHVSALRRKLEQHGHRMVRTGRDGSYALRP